MFYRYARGVLPEEPKATVGIEFVTHSVPLSDGGLVQARIWDTAGQEKFRSITAVHYRRSAGAMIVFDLTNLKSFLSAQKWLDDVRAAADPDVKIILIGNKLDLIKKDPTQRQVPTEKAHEFAVANHLLYTEASAVTNINVKEAFETLIKDIHDYHRQLAMKNAGLSGSGLGMMQVGGALGAGEVISGNGGIVLRPSSIESAKTSARQMESNPCSCN